AVENADFEYLEQAGFESPFADPKNYFVIRYFNEDVAEHRYDEKEGDVLSASEGFRVFIPVFSQVEGKQRVVGKMTLRKNKKQSHDVTYDPALSKDVFEKDAVTPYTIFEKAPSFFFLEEYCNQNDLGALQSVSIATVWWNASFQKELVFLKTAQGSYVYDPFQLGKRIDLTSISQEGVPLYEADQFAKAYLRNRDEQASATGNAVMELISRLFS
ncbi:MAG: hypothetical protein IJC19_08050, partial [Clostridia bacterium]|nr:hypothetical protein [Clostridia bacterium]